MNITQAGSKKCTKCLTVKPYSDFRKARGYRDGVCSWCHSCEKNYSRQYHLDNYEMILQKNRKWYEDNKVLVKSRVSNYRRTVLGRFVRAKASAKKRGKEFLLTLEQYEKLICMPCHYCGDRLGETGSGLDRIDSSKGYTIENTRPCCWDCNTAKNDLNEEDFKKLILKIGHHWLKGN